MNLNLTKPLVVFDIEATGLDISKDRIVEIAMVKVNTNQSRETKVIRINPEMPIPAETSAIHGIFDKDVVGAPNFKAVAGTIVAFIGNADLSGYNALKFDIPLLMEEFLRSEVDFDLKNRRVVDVQNIFHKLEPRTLKAAYKFYCQGDLVNNHNALADTEATLDVLLAQLEKYDGVTHIENKTEKEIVFKNDVNVLQELSKMNDNLDFAGRIIKDAKGEAVFNFGKHKGKKVIDVLTQEPSYYAWMMNGDFSLYTKKVLTAIKLSMLTKS